MLFEAYIHTNGELQVKRCIPELDLMVDTSSPFVKKYLGRLKAENFQAKDLFEAKVKDNHV